MAKSVLFVCIENACRSQMAEGFARARGGEAVEVYSAGSFPRGSVDRLTVESMRDAGIDISAQRSNGLDAVPQREYDYIVTMGCGDACPQLPAKHRLDWAVPNPGGATRERMAQIRDEIGRLVDALLQKMTEEVDGKQ